MPSYTQKLTEKGLIRPPNFLPDNVMYETIMGSIAYGVSESTSDLDVYGFCMPPKTTVFPHLAGEIRGFGQQVQRFDQYQQHHIHDDAGDYDLTIYSIVRYFQLCLECNPNMIDSLFTPRDCVLHSTRVGELVRQNQRLFLHKGAWHKFKGYAYAQLHKMKSQNRQGKRREIVEKYGYDVKFGYHVLRLLDEIEQILMEGDIDLRRNREQLKAVRRGDVPEADLITLAAEKEKRLERLYVTSTLRHRPDEPAIKQLLMDCLEHHYGSLDNAVSCGTIEVDTLRKIHELTGRFV